MSDDDKPFRVLTDEEAIALGAEVELSEADRAPPKNLPAPATEVVQGIRSTPPIYHDTGPPPEPAPVPWELLPERTRAEMEAGAKAVGGGLSARETYERNRTSNIRRPEALVTVLAEAAAEEHVISAKTLAEMEEGRRVLAEKYAVQKAFLDRQAEMAATKIKEKPTGDELGYFMPQPPPGVK